MVAAAETIKGGKLLKGGNYSRKYGTSIITFSAVQVVTANRQLALEGISKETLMHVAQSKFNSGMI